MCVCVCVCLSGYTFPQFSTDLLQMLMKPSTGHDTFRGLYILCVHATLQCAHINRMRMLHETNYRQRFIYRQRVLNSHAYSKLSNGFSPNLLFMFTHRARACVRAKHARMCAFAYFERIMSKFAGNILRLTISGKDYVLFIVTYHVYACKRASASSCVITHSLIYGRILFKFTVNIQYCKRLNAQMKRKRNENKTETKRERNANEMHAKCKRNANETFCKRFQLQAD
jgi:hypothetical protein